MIVVVNYGMGNIGSVANMLQKVGAEVTVSSDPQDIAKAEKLVLPGVGAFDQGVQNLRERHLIEPLQEKVVQQKTPILGICLGLQLFSRSSEEGKLPGLGWIAASTLAFRPDQATEALRIPHMGWNKVRMTRPDPLVKGLENENRFYFVHSFHLQCDNANDALGKTEYGIEFDSIVRHENIMGTQFHAEKSHRFGMQVIKNFVWAI